MEDQAMSKEQIAELETEIFELGCRLRKLRQAEPGVEVENYTFETLEGTTTLLDLFAGHNTLLAIHNMGQACRYCTLWADGINAFLPHLESALAVTLLSKDDPATQRRMANARGWRFRTGSHGGGDYIKEQTAAAEYGNTPGAVCYELRGGKIYRKNSCVFGPGDLYCSAWHLLGLAGLDTEDWTPQYNYWKRPQQMEDGGENLVD
jgi:predicted dithiol-disulfide oxidoreductase (DUF899 family)